MLKKVAWNIVSQLIGKALGAGATFLATLLIARAYGAEGYGDFIKITTYIALYYTFADFGLNAIYLQRAQEGKDEDERAWAGLLGLRVLGGTLLMLVALAVLAFLPPGKDQGYTALVRLGIIIFSPVIFFQTLLTSANAVFQKFLRYDFSSLAVGIGSAVTLALLWLITGLGAGTFGVVFAVAALLSGGLVTALVALWLARRLTGSISISFNLQQMLRILLPAVPLGLVLLFNLIYFHVDSLILTLTRPTAEVGVYGLAYKVFEVVLVFPIFFMNAAYPILLKARNLEVRTSREQFLKILQRSFFFLVFSSLFLVVIVWLAAPWLTLIKEDFAASIPALRVLSLGFPFFFISALTMWGLIALGKQTPLVFIYGISMLINIVLNILFIPQYGYIAAAWITVVSEGLVLLVSAPVLARVLSVYPRK